MNFELFTTPRLTLRKLTVKEFEYIFAHYTDDEIMTFLGLKTVEDLAKERSKVEGGFVMFNKSLVAFQLLDKTSSKVLGMCGYHTWYILHHRAEFGYHIYDDSDKNQGLMSEALTFILEYGFTTMNLNRIEAMIAPHNVPSLKLIRKFGFIQEGLLRKSYLREGVYEDSYVFSLLKSEYFV